MKLGRLLKCYRIHEEITIRDLAKEIGIGTATLYRLEQGKDVDGKATFKILIWLSSEGE